MSRQRVRPTRDDTRDRLFDAAAEVFTDRGIGAASVEDIVSAAGFTRGAFYSNFANKDELIIAMLQDHVVRSAQRNLELLAEHHDPIGFVAALRAVDRSRQDPLGRAPLLHMELILYTVRAAQHRPELAERLAARRQLIAEIVRRTGAPRDLDADQVAAILLALEDGFRLHRLIDPDTTPSDSFTTAVSALQRAMGVGEGAPPPAAATGPASS